MMMKKMIVLGLGSLLLAACVGEASTEVEDGTVDDAEQALCLFLPPSLDAPSATATLTLPWSGEIGESVQRTSPDDSYAFGGDGVYTTEIAGFTSGGLPHQTVFAENVTAFGNAVQASCPSYHVDAEFHCRKDTGCWYSCGTVNATGVWVPAAGPTPAHCEAIASLAVPAGVTKVRVAAEAWNLKPSDLRDPVEVKEGGYWYH